MIYRKLPHIPYVYLIGWSAQDMYYIGYQSIKSAHPLRLMEEYKTSSHYVHAFIKEHGYPDVVTVLNECRDTAHARATETKILRRLNARQHPKLLNKTNTGKDFSYISPRGTPAWNKGKPLTEEHKAKLRAAKAERKALGYYKEVALERNKSPSYQENREFMNSEEYKTKISSASKQMWATYDPEARQARVLKVAERLKDPTIHAYRIQRTKEARSTLEAKQKTSEHTKSIWDKYTPEQRAARTANAVAARRRKQNERQTNHVPNLSSSNAA